MTGRVALSALLILASGVYAVSADAPAAQAAAGSGGCGSASSGGTSGGGGSISNGTITMWAQLTARSQSYLCPAGTSYGSGGTNWQPPQCWWAPEYTPSQLAAAIESLGAGGSTDDTYTAFTGEYAAGGTGATFTANYQSTDGPPWELFNVGAAPAGEWWGLVWSDDITPQGVDDCTTIDDDHFPEDWYWVTPTTGAPEPGDAPTLDGETLAEYVAGKVMLNPIVVNSSPNLSANTPTTVGLPTWLWADGKGNTVIRHEICTTQAYGHICVNLTAQAENYSISAGDPAARIYADCKANADGTIGEAYATGDNGDPPCGITFETPGTWPIALDTTWNVTITWDGGALTLQPAPQTETDLNATVQAVQAINISTASPSPIS